MSHTGPIKCREALNAKIQGLIKHTLPDKNTRMLQSASYLSLYLSIEEKIVKLIMHNGLYQCRKICKVHLVMLNSHKHIFRTSTLVDLMMTVKLNCRPMEMILAAK